MSRIANSTSFTKSESVRQLSAADYQQVDGILNLFLLLVTLSTEKFQV